MRLTTVFNKLLALQGAWVQAVRFCENGLVVRVQPRARRHQCPACRYATRARYDRRLCQWRQVALGKWAVVIEAELCRVECPEHGVRTERVRWAGPGSRFTRDFEELAAWLAREMSISAVTRLLKVSWSSVGRMIRRVVDRHLDADRLDNLYAIGIDEVSYKKGHNYVTLVVNHATGEPVWMGEGRSRASLSRFFDQLSPAQTEKIQVVSMDMCAAYYEEVRARVPEAKICFDPFHVVKLANEACSEVRRTEARERKGTRTRPCSRAHAGRSCARRRTCATSSTCAWPRSPSSTSVSTAATCSRRAAGALQLLEANRRASPPGLAGVGGPVPARAVQEAQAHLALLRRGRGQRHRAGRQQRPARRTQHPRRRRAAPGLRLPLLDCVHGHDPALLHQAAACAAGLRLGVSRYARHLHPAAPRRPTRRDEEPDFWPRSHRISDSDKLTALASGG